MYVVAAHTAIVFVGWKREYNSKRKKIWFKQIKLGTCYKELL